LTTPAPPAPTVGSGATSAACRTGAVEPELATTGAELDADCRANGAAGALA